MVAKLMKIGEAQKNDLKKQQSLLMAQKAKIEELKTERARFQEAKATQDVEVEILRQ